MEIETKEKPHILHFQVKNIGFCQQSEVLKQSTKLESGYFTTVKLPLVFIVPHT